MHRLKKIWLKNYRSCHDIEVELSSFTPLVGYNNAGKSTIIQGIIWLLSPSGGITENDFCGNDITQPIIGIGELSGISEQLLDKLDPKHKAKIEKYISDDGVLFIKRIQAKPGSTKGDRPLFILRPGEDFSNEDSWDKNPAGIDAAISKLFPSPIHIEAMADASQDVAKNTASSTLGKLLKDVLGSVEEQHGVKISDAVDELKSILSAEGDKRAPELTKIDASANRALVDLFPGIEIRSEIPAPSIHTLFKAGTIKVKDPHRGETWHEFDSMGHGAQRTIQMALVRCLAEHTQAADDPECRLLLIDEPELYLHPQAIEQVRAALESLVNVGYQVIFSTHSPMLIERKNVPYTLLIRKNDFGTKVLPTMSSAAKDKINGNRAQAETLFTLSNSNQILFSEKVLLVEGSTEARLIPVLYEKTFGKTLSYDKIALVPLGGSGNTGKAIAILNAMGIPYQAVVDLDALFCKGEEYGVIVAPDAKIEACKAYFDVRKQANEIELNGQGLPINNDNMTAAQAYAECAASPECAAHIADLHQSVKDDHNIWAWPVGDIECVLHLTGKGEKHWVRFIADIEDNDLAHKVKDQVVLTTFLDWIKG